MSAKIVFVFILSTSTHVISSSDVKLINSMTEMLKQLQNHSSDHEAFFLYYARKASCNISGQTEPLITTNIRNIINSTSKSPTPDNSLKKDCAELLLNGNTQSGEYNISPTRLVKDQIRVYCDMKTDGGGWIVFQRRAEFPGRQQNFSLSFDEYAHGFGNLSEEFWLGNDYLHTLTSQDNVTLRVDLTDFSNRHRHAVYDSIRVGNASTQYVLNLGPYTGGTAGDSLKYHSGNKFWTYDKDVNQCSMYFRGGWWYVHCVTANLNGLYKRGTSSTPDIITWDNWRGDKYSLKSTEMKIRPKNFNPQKR